MGNRIGAVMSNGYAFSNRMKDKKMLGKRVARHIAIYGGYVKFIEKNVTW